MSDKTERCRNCAEWISGSEFGTPGVDGWLADDRFPGLWGYCSRMSSKGGEPVDKTQIAFGADYECYSAGVETHETFGCVMFHQITESK